MLHTTFLMTRYHPKFEIQGHCHYDDKEITKIAFYHNGKSLCLTR